MRRTRAQRGEGKAGCIFWLLILGVAALVAWEFIPTKIATMQLSDHMEEIAQLNQWQEREFFINSILQRAGELDLPIEKKQIKVTKNAKRLVMEVTFTKPVEVLMFKYDWNIRIKKDRDIFLL